jgi:hypothetical protein
MEVSDFPQKKNFRESALIGVSEDIAKKFRPMAYTFNSKNVSYEAIRSATVSRDPALSRPPVFRETRSF